MGIDAPPGRKKKKAVDGGFTSKYLSFSTAHVFSALPSDSDSDSDAEFVYDEAAGDIFAVGSRKALQKGKGKAVDRFIEGKLQMLSAFI
jgi:hypothetical protein